MQGLYEGALTREDTPLHIQTRTLLQEVAADLDTFWGGGEITPSSYETAWVAMVREPHQPGRLAFPESLEWLLRTQQRDGSWQGGFPTAILPTMAAWLALAKAPRQTQRLERAEARAAKYLARVFPRWDATDVTRLDTPLFEFLLPLLVDEFAALGIRPPLPHLEGLRERQAEKLDRLPLGLLYAGRSNLIHGLEALAPVLDYNRLQTVQSPHGGYGNSPAATASVLIYHPLWDERAAAWLRHLAAQGFGGSRGAMPTSHPADTFEVGWVLHFLLQGGMRVDARRNATHRILLRWLQECLAVEGAGFARSSGLPPDVDDTAVVVTVLRRCGIPVPLDTLWHFEVDSHFVCYAGERTASITANAHVLEALLGLRPLPSDDSALYHHHKRATEKVVEYLLEQRTSLGYWVDKWHLSPYYATLSAVLALSRAALPAVHQELRLTVDWLLDSQRGEGGWGNGAATMEETAYVLLALRALRSVLPFYQAQRCSQAVIRGKRLLLDVSRSPLLTPVGRRAARVSLVSPDESPPLWIDKSTYAPPRVIRAAILAALR